MVNPFEIMPVLALAVLIACIPILSDRVPERPAPRAVPRYRGRTVPLIARRDVHRE